MPLRRPSVDVAEGAWVGERIDEPGGICVAPQLQGDQPETGRPPLGPLDEVISCRLSRTRTTGVASSPRTAAICPGTVSTSASDTMCRRSAAARTPMIGRIAVAIAVHSARTWYGELDIPTGADGLGGGRAATAASHPVRMRPGHPDAPTMSLQAIPRNGRPT